MYVAGLFAYGMQVNMYGIIRKKCSSPFGPFYQAPVAGAEAVFYPGVNRLLHICQPVQVNMEDPACFTFILIDNRKGGAAYNIFNLPFMA
jgi:hypothetical protein